MIAKYSISLVIAVMAALLVFVGMQLMISGDERFDEDDSTQPALNFVRVDSAEDQVETRDRRQPDPPPEPEPSPDTPDATVEQDSPAETPQMSMDMPSLDASLGTGDGFSMEGISATESGMSGFDSDATPTLRVPPNYPRQAQRAGLEGYVTMAVEIRADGSVASVEILDSEPPRMFDDAAVNAMRRWKFQPKTVDGENQPQRARQTIEFTLD